MARDHSSEQPARLKVYELTDIDTEKVDVVDRAANKRTFLLAKRDGEVAITEGGSTVAEKHMTDEEKKAAAEKTEKAEKEAAEKKAAEAKAKEEADKQAAAKAEADAKAKAEKAAAEKEAAEKAEQKSEQNSDDVQKRIDAAVAKANAERDELAKRVASLEADKASAAHASVKKGLVDAGKLPQSLHKWADTQSAEQLTVWGEGAPVVQKGRTESPAPANGGDGTMTSLEKQVAAMLGNVTDENIVEAKKRIAAQRAGRTN